MGNSKVLPALQFLDPADLSYTDWVAVGMSLKEEGFPCSVWDEWSRNDSRYHVGECERKWRSFKGDSSPVKGGTIVQMARERGWIPDMAKDGGMEWDDAIEYDGDEDTGGEAAAKSSLEPPKSWHPTEDLITYLRTLFKPDDIVGYVTETYQIPSGERIPSRGAYDRTVGELIASLQKHPDDIGATIGDWQEDMGAWIRFNPLDGSGISDSNVTAYRYALVESDTLSIEEQAAAYKRLRLPVAALVHSGKKSLHAIVRIDAADYTQYRQRVDTLYKFLGDNGVPIDKQNRNPSRLSRLPGVTRDGAPQYLVATNQGCKSWSEWSEYIEGFADDLPDIVSLDTLLDNPPELPGELIEGILRRGHKMLISGASKAGKSFLLMELCVAIAEGTEWLGFKCAQGKVLYVNLEIDKASAVHRFAEIRSKLGLTKQNESNISMWPLRGHAVPLDKLAPILIRRVEGQHFDAIVIDPIYKVITGDENNASEMGAFCNQFDKICTATGCATIYCHHHSKGAQGAKRAMDRASGSGVFARDPDAQLDIIQLELTTDLKNYVRDGYATAWRLETSLREFRNPEPVNFWFEYPVHRLDTTGDLARCGAEGSFEANLTKSSKRTTKEERRQLLDNAYDNNMCLDKNGKDKGAAITEMAEYSGNSERTLKRYVEEFGDDYTYKNGTVLKKRE